MYSVSLLPSHYILQNQARKRKDKLLKISIVVMCVLLAVYAVMVVFHTIRVNKLKSIQKSNQAIQDEISELEHLSSLNNDINMVYKLAKAAAGTNPSWDEFIVTISESAPGTIGLTSFELTYQEDTRTGKIQGLALEHKTISEWLKTLNELPEVSNVRCTHSKQTQEDSNSFVQFEITMDIEPGSGFEIPGGNGI